MIIDTLLGWAIAAMHTAEEVRTIFKKRGVSLSDWARRRGFSQSLVYQVLSGRRQASRGESYEIAVALGLKTDKEISYQEIDQLLSAERGDSQ